ncbi:uncharacterized protein JCM6883_006070 [Sporobolomyces salmoneus]|uniref:uncharacterized protein n=1 Tax=Sporobolomyces salmoneus TaxID=183962 RepID=UPI0031776ACD
MSDRTRSTNDETSGEEHAEQGTLGTEKGDRADGASSGRTTSTSSQVWRGKLPTILSGPIEALFPRNRPSPIYGNDHLPSFITDATKRSKWQNRKHLFRSSIVTLACFILLLEPKSLNVLGQAAFFAALVSCFLPPTFPVMLLLIVSTMLVMGMLIGWAWGAAAMAAALRARSQVILASSVQRVQAGIAGSTNPDVAYRMEIFKGGFLDPRSSSVFGVFLAVGTFVLGLLRAHRPKLALLAIFGAIVIDVMCTYGPLFPINQYTLAETFLIPTACEIAIALAATILIFPKTLNSSYTTDLVDKFLSPILQRSHLHSKVLSSPAPSYGTPHETNEDRVWKGFAPIWSGTQEAMAGGLEGLLGTTGLLELEISFGRLSAKDLASLTDSLRELLARSVGLAILSTTVSSRRKRVLEAEEALSSSSSEKPRSEEKFHETARMHRFRTRADLAEVQNKHTLPDLLPIFESASSPLRTASDEVLLSAMDWLTQCNSTRWLRQPKVEVVEQEAAHYGSLVETLEHELQIYRTERREELVAPFADFFDSKTGKLLPEVARSFSFSPNTLFTLLAASDNLLTYIEAVLAFARQISYLQDHRRRNKIWFPTGLRKIGNLLKGEKGSSAVGDGQNPDELEDVADDDTASSSETAVEGEGDKKRDEAAKKAVAEAMSENRRDPDARPPHSYQKLTIGFHKFGKWLGTPETIFAIRFALVSVALWLPQIFRTTAQLSCYSLPTLSSAEQKLLWAQIMAQTGLSVYSGDQILSTIQRLIGTACGLVYGLVIWYTGSGNGGGSRPGLGAAFYILFLPVLAIRLFTPLASMQGTLMLAVTTVLVVGYSFQDGPNGLPVYGNPGVGYNIAWRRALLVVIGVAVATIVMLIPTQSSKVLVRRTHATTISELGRVYANILSAWIKEGNLPEETENDEPTSSAFSTHAAKAARAKMLALRLKLNSSRIAIIQSTYEINFKGDFPKEEWLESFRVQMHLLQALGQVGHSLVRLDRTWRKRLVSTTAFLNQPLIADVSTTFALVSLALRQKSPLPQATPGPLIDRLLYHDTRLRFLSRENTTDDNFELEGASIGSFELTFDVLKHESFSIYSNCLQGLASILLDVDELEVAAKSLLGVSYFPGYELLLERQSHV